MAEVGAVPTTAGPAAAPAAAVAAPGAPALEVADVRVRFGGNVAVDGVTLRVAPGEIVGLVGPNGAGKTTLLDAVSGFVTPERGSVRLGGRDITGLLPYQRARAGLGRSFQDALLYPTMTVREVLASGFHPFHVHGAISEAFGLRAARHEEELVQAAALELLELVDLTSHLDHRVGELSFGTTRAVELAWLAARHPAVLLLDEPASGLQQSEVAHLGALIERIRRSAAVVVIDHDVPFVAGLAHRMVALDLGRVIAEGPPEQVLADGAVLRAYLGPATSGRRS